MQAGRAFRRLLVALRLYDGGGVALGSVAWTRVDSGAWRSGRARRRRHPPGPHAHRGRRGGRAARRSAAWSPAAPRAPGSSRGRCRASGWPASAPCPPRRSATSCSRSARCSSRRGRRPAGCPAASPRCAPSRRTGWRWPSARSQAVALERAIIAGTAPHSPAVDDLIDRALRVPARAAARRAVRAPRRRRARAGRPPARRDARLTSTAPSGPSGFLKVGEAVSR